MDAIRWKGTALALLDQTRLPVEEVWDDYTDYRAVAEAIRRLVVRGAPARTGPGTSGRGWRPPWRPWRPAVPRR